MKRNIQRITDIQFDKSRKYIIYGAGDAGKAIAWYLEFITQIDDFCFCDGNPNMLNHDEKHPILMLNEVVGENTLYIIGFIENDNRKILSVYRTLLSFGITEKDIIVVDLDLNEYSQIQYMYIEKYINTYLEKKELKEKIECVKEIIFLANGFTPQSEQRGGGGPIGAICMQKKYLGNSFNGIPIIYPYYNEERATDRLTNKYAFILEPINQIDNIINDLSKDVVFIVNDIFSAFALAVKGKNYSLIYHGQGDIVQELSCWGTDFSDKEKKLIWFVQKVAIENAYKCFFPSRGAFLFFKKGFGLELKCSSQNPLYNTIYDVPIPKKIMDILKDEEKITFLSVGQMTWLKGIDRIPFYLEQLSKSLNKKIRWIVVADGILKDEVYRKIQIVNLSGNNRIEYINIDYRLSHSEVFYLMDISDIYIMLHRVSIFDFATLEAMYHGKAIILSSVLGNDEFNKMQNIMLVDEDTDIGLVKKYIEEREKFGGLNKLVYEKYFSKKEFINRYSDFLNDFIYTVEAEKKDI